MAISDAEKQAFIERMMVGIVPIRYKLETAPWILVLAHGAYESAWGRCIAARIGANFFNICAGNYWSGKTVAGADLEYRYVPGSPVPIGKPIPITQKFRSYPSDTAGINDYLIFLSGMPRYQPAYARLIAGDEIGFVRLLGPDRAHEKPPVGGYYTLPTSEYLKSFGDVLKQVRGTIQSGQWPEWPGEE
jgi:hypothetical protein